MTVAVFPIDAETTALVDMLRGQTNDGIYRSGDVFGTVTHPYAVLHSVTDQLVLPSMVEDGSGFRSVWQIDTVGKRQDQAQAFMAKVAAWLLASDGAGGWAHPIAVAGWTCIGRNQIAGMGTPPEGQPQRKVWVTRRRFELIWDLD